MTDIIHEKWRIVPTDKDGDEAHCGFDEFYRVEPADRQGWQYGFMENKTYYNDAPDLPVAQHIVDIHNFIVEQGGLESVKCSLRELSALEGAGVDNWDGYEYVDWGWVRTEKGSDE